MHVMSACLPRMRIIWRRLSGEGALFFAGASQSFSLGAERVARSAYITPWLQAASYGHMAIWPGESARTSSAYGKKVLSACSPVHLYAYAPLHLPTGVTLSALTTCAPSDRTPAARLELTLTARDLADDGCFVLAARGQLCGTPRRRGCCRLPPSRLPPTAGQRHEDRLFVIGPATEWAEARRSEALRDRQAWTVRRLSSFKALGTWHAQVGGLPQRHTHMEQHIHHRQRHEPERSLPSPPSIQRTQLQSTASHQGART